MDQIEKKSRPGLYILAGLAILAILSLGLVLAEASDGSQALTDENLAANILEQTADETDSCLDYMAATSQINAKYNLQIEAFWRLASQHPAAAETNRTLGAVRQNSDLDNYDIELNALRAEYGLSTYVFDNHPPADPANDGDSYCHPRSAEIFAAETKRLREAFDLDNHLAAVSKLNDQHQLTDFIANNPIEAGWSDDQKQAVLVEAQKHDLDGYLAAIDRLYDDYNLESFETLLADLGIRYNLSPGWSAPSDPATDSSYIYDRDSKVSYKTIVNIRNLLKDPGANP